MKFYYNVTYLNEYGWLGTFFGLCLFFPHFGSNKRNLIIFQKWHLCLSVPRRPIDVYLWYIWDSFYWPCFCPHFGRIVIHNWDLLGSGLKRSVPTLVYDNILNIFNSCIIYRQNYYMMLTCIINSRRMLA